MSDIIDITAAQHEILSKECPGMLIDTVSGSKIDFTDFSVLTSEMAIYCDQDVDLTVKLLLTLLKNKSFPLQKVVTIEHQTATIIAAQEQFGFYLDIEMTRALNTKLLKEKGELARKLASIFGPKFLKDGPEKVYKKPSKVKKYLPNISYVPSW